MEHFVAFADDDVSRSSFKITVGPIIAVIGNNVVRAVLEHPVVFCFDCEFAAVDKVDRDEACERSDIVTVIEEVIVIRLGLCFVFKLRVERLGNEFVVRRINYQEFKIDLIGIVAHRNGMNVAARKFGKRTVVIPYIERIRAVERIGPIEGDVVEYCVFAVSQSHFIAGHDHAQTAFEDIAESLVVKAFFSAVFYSDAVYLAVKHLIFGLFAFILAAVFLNGREVIGRGRSVNVGIVTVFKRKTDGKYVVIETVYGRMHS